METFFTILAATLPVYFLIGLGVVMRIYDVLTPEADRSLMRLTIYLLYPCLILDALMTNEVATEPGNLLVGPVAGLLSVGVGCAIAWVAGRGLPSPSRRTFAFSTGLYNYGFIALPLVIELFQQSTVGVLFVFNLGTEIGVWTIGVTILSGGGLRSAFRQAFVPPVLAVLAGVALNLTGAHALVPDYAARSLEMAGGCAVPLALILTGAIIYDFRKDFNPLVEVGASAIAVVLRLAAIPAVFLAAAKWLPLTQELRQVLIVQAAMPAAMVPIVLARLHGGDVPLAIRIVLLTCLCGLFTIPLVIRFGLWFVGIAG